MPVGHQSKAGDGKEKQPTSQFEPCLPRHMPICYYLILHLLASCLLWTIFSQENDMQPQFKPKMYRYKNYCILTTTGGPHRGDVPATAFPAIAHPLARASPPTAAAAAADAFPDNAEQVGRGQRRRQRRRRRRRPVSQAIGGRPIPGTEVLLSGLPPGHFIDDGGPRCL